jgi:hypothetical protein
MTQVLINELMASNTKTVKDPQGEFDDWIELYNPTSESIDLSGMFISDSAQSLRKWPFPAGTKVEPHGYLVLWADENGKAKDGLHLNFKLSSKGEELYLARSNGADITVIDSIVFEKQSNDVSYGRRQDGEKTWTQLVPTPGKANQDQE